MTSKSSLTKKEKAILIRLLPKLRWPLPYPVFLALCESVPMIVVYCAAMPDPKHLALVHRNDDPLDRWCIPGGVLYHKEKVATALARVAKNKLGVRLQKVRFVGYYESRDEREHGIRLIFAGKPIGALHRGKMFNINRLPKKFLHDHMPGMRMIRQLK